MPEKGRPRNQRLLTEEEVQERRDILLAGVGQFNAGYFFEAHETLEDLWYPSPLPVRTFLQGLIQLAAALVHLVRREYPGTVALLEAALAKLEGFPPDYLGIDLETLRSEARRAYAGLIALGPERLEEWDRTGIPKIRLTARNP